jgi:precorrin-8X/cobalt-precorrin-8 methylmutase
MFRPDIIAPASIEEESFRIIEAELSPHFGFSPQQHLVVRRVIHATADFEYARMLRFHPGAFAAFKAAMQRKAPMICDVQMVVAGISKPKLAVFGSEIVSPINDADVAEAAKKAGHTRAIESMRKMARAGHGGVLAIGNAPTALTEAIRLVKEEGWRPDLIIGMPVGFVSAAESKDSLAAGDAEPVPYITTLGRKGGSPAVVATVNALLLWAEGKTEIKG